MRYALRNKHKIKEAYSQEILDRIVKSLDTHFTSGKTIRTRDSSPYPILLVDDVGHSTNMIAFYVVTITYDVYNLAFKEFIG